MSLNEETADLAIVGGGVAGLAAGVAAARLGASAIVLEAAAEPGGLARSLRTAGHTFDCSGHVLHLSRDRTRALVASVTGADEWVEHERRAFVLVGDRLVPYPFQRHLAHAPAAVREECLAALPATEPPAELPATAPLAAWIAATLGPGIGRHFMVPYNEKVATVPLAELTCEWLGRFVPRPSLADVRAGAAHERVDGAGYNRRFLYPRRGGIDLLWRGLAAQVPRLCTGTRVVGIDTVARRVHLAGGARVRYRAAVIVSAPLAAVAELVTPTAPALAAARRLRASAVTCVNVGVRTCPPWLRDAHWVYLPDVRFRAYRVGCYDRFAAGMAPPGRHGLYVEIAHGAADDEAGLVRAALADLTALGVIATPGDVDVVLPVRIPVAYVIPDAACATARAALLAELAARDVHMVGRYGRWEYAAIEDALLQGTEAVERVVSGAAREARP